MYNLFFYLHILGIVGVAAPIIVHLASLVMGSNANPDTLMGVYRLSAITVENFAAIGGGLALIAGLTMVTIGNPPDVAWGKLWIWSAIVLFIIAAVVDTVPLTRVGRMLIAELPKGGPTYQATLKQYHAYSYIHLALWMAIASLMVFKPF